MTLFHVCVSTVARYPQIGRAIEFLSSPRPSPWWKQALNSQIRGLSCSRRSHLT